MRNRGTRRGARYRAGDTYVGYLEVQKHAPGRYRRSIADVSDPNKLGSVMYPAGKPQGVHLCISRNSTDRDRLRNVSGELLRTYFETSLHLEPALAAGLAERSRRFL